MLCRCGILARLVVASQILWCSLICLGNNFSFGLFCTLQIGGVVAISVLVFTSILEVGILFGIGLSKIAFVIDCCTVVLGFVANVLVVVVFSCGGAVFSAKVTCFSFSVVTFLGMLLSSLLIFSNPSICASPSTFFLPFRVCVKSSSALMIVSTGVKVG